MWGLGRGCGRFRILFAFSGFPSLIQTNVALPPFRRRAGVGRRDTRAGDHRRRHPGGDDNHTQPPQEPVNPCGLLSPIGENGNATDQPRRPFTATDTGVRQPRSAGDGSSCRATRSRGGQTEGDASAVGVRQIGLCSGQVAMGRPWRRRYRDDRWPSSDPLPTQGDVHAGILAELVAAGFADPEEIGRGGFGVVYRCTQRALDRVVAVKVLTADLEPDNLERFVREQVAMGKLSGHPHIVTIFQVGTTATGRPFIVMQYHPHGSLEAKVHDNGPVGWADALHIGVKVAGALETAHRREHAASRRQTGQHPAHRVRRAAADGFRDRPDQRRVRNLRRR